MQAILALAERLGRAVADSLQAKALREARAELSKHQDLTQLLKDYRGHVDKIARLEEQNKPIEVDDKHRLRDLQGRLVSDEAFKKFTAAQVEYVDLMRRVNEALRKELAETEFEGG